MAHEFKHPIIGQEAICPDGLGRVTGFMDRFPKQWICVDTYVGSRECQWDHRNVKLVPVFHEVDGIVMPKSLTAENGAKGLLTGEFSEKIIKTCPFCDNGLIYTEFEDDDEGETCESCDGAGDYILKVPIGWSTIKEIYAMAVKELGS